MGEAVKEIQKAAGCASSTNVYSRRYIVTARWPVPADSIKNR
jgi:hypothetical protein